MKRKLIYTITQWTWGLPQTLTGAAVRLIYRNDPHYNYRGAHVTEWDRKDGVSLGKFIFVPKTKGLPDKSGPTDRDVFLLDHEYGHTIQSLILGPTYLLLVGLPSVLWNRLPYFREKRRRTGRSYYSVIFERTASRLGERTGRKPR